MLKKPITFEDLDGNTVTQTFYFNLSKGELFRQNLRNMTLTEDGEADVDAFRAQLDAIIKSKSGRVIMDTFEDIIAKAYGVREDDGITFTKSEEISRRFMNTDAYNVLFMELVTNATAAADFINAILPKDMDAPAGEERSRDLSEKIDKVVGQSVSVPTRTPLGLVKDPATMTHEELMDAVRKAQQGGE